MHYEFGILLKWFLQLLKQPNSFPYFPDLSPAEIPAAGSAPVVAPDNKRLTMESDRDKPTVKAVPKVPKGKPR